MAEQTKIIITINKDEKKRFDSINIKTEDAHIYDLMSAAYHLFRIIAKKDPDGTAFSSMFNLAKNYSDKNEDKNEDKNNHSDSDESK